MLVCICLCVCLHLSVCLFAFVCMFVCICLCVQVKRELTHTVEKMFHHLDETAKGKVVTLNGNPLTN